MSLNTRFQHRDVDLIACGLALAIAATLFWFGIWPVFSAEDEAQQLRNRMMASKSQLEAAQERYRELRQQITGTRERLAELAIVLDAPDQDASRQDEIGKVFARQGIKVAQLSVGAIEHGPLVDTIPMRLSGTGSFPDLVTTMHMLREVFPDMAVTTFQIGGGGGRGGDDSNGVTFSLGVAWYVARDDTGRG